MFHLSHALCSQGVDYVFVDHPSFPRPGGIYADQFGAYGDNQVGGKGLVGVQGSSLCSRGLRASGRRGEGQGMGVAPVGGMIWKHAAGRTT